MGSSHSPSHFIHPQVLMVPSSPIPPPPEWSRESQRLQPHGSRCRSPSSSSGSPVGGPVSLSESCSSSCKTMAGVSAAYLAEPCSLSGKGEMWAGGGGSRVTTSYIGEDELGGSGEGISKVRCEHVQQLWRNLWCQGRVKVRRRRR